LEIALGFRTLIMLHSSCLLAITMILLQWLAHSVYSCMLQRWSGLYWGYCQDLDKVDIALLGSIRPVCMNLGQMNMSAYQFGVCVAGWMLRQACGWPVLVGSGGFRKLKKLPWCFDVGSFDCVQPHFIINLCVCRCYMHASHLGCPLLLGSSRRQQSCKLEGYRVFTILHVHGLS
jgi:hypothetical protein